MHCGIEGRRNGHDVAMGFRRGAALTRKSWSLIRPHRRLLVFPALQALLLMLAIQLLIVVADAIGGWLGFMAAAMLLIYPITFLSTFFGVAFIAMGRRVLDGEPISVRDGLRCAAARVRVIAAWSLLATGVGVVLQALQQVRGGWLATQLAGWIVGLAWGVATYFVVPLLALEETGPVESVRRSSRLVKQRWGEGLGGVVTVGGILLLGMIPAMVLLSVGAFLLEDSLLAGLALLLAGVLLFAVVLVATSTLGAMFQLVLYRFATTGEVPGAFAAADLESAFRERRSRRLVGRLRGR